MKRHKRKLHANHERWLVSYADFAFSVVIYASSQTDIRKQAQVAHAINQAFKSLGLFPPDKADPRAKSLASSADEAVAAVNIVLGDELSASPSTAVKADFERMRKELEARLSNQIAPHVGSTSPHPGSIGSIDSIIAILRPIPTTSA